MFNKEWQDISVLIFDLGHPELNVSGGELSSIAPTAWTNQA